MPMASWGSCLEPLENLESHVLLELKALGEGTWKMGEFAAFSQNLFMQVMLELHALLKFAPKPHPELQAMLIDVQQYKPTWVLGGTSAVPKELDFTRSAAGKWEDVTDELVDLHAIHYTQSALGKVHLPPKACFILRRAVHMQFDGSS